MTSTEGMPVYMTAAVQANTDIALYTTHLHTCQAVTIALDDERLALEFYDVASLERLRDIAARGADLLRAAIQAA